MEAFQERMVAEFKELRDRIVKLDSFISNNPLFDKLDKKEKYLQVQQLTGMRIYLKALKERLDYQGIKVELL